MYRPLVQEGPQYPSQPYTEQSLGWQFCTQTPKSQLYCTSAAPSENPSAKSAAARAPTLASKRRVLLIVHLLEVMWDMASDPAPICLDHRRSALNGGATY